MLNVLEERDHLSLQAGTSLGHVGLTRLALRMTRPKLLGIALTRYSLAFHEPEFLALAL